MICARRIQSSGANEEQHRRYANAISAVAMVTLISCHRLYGGSETWRASSSDPDPAVTFSHARWPGERDTPSAALIAPVQVFEACIAAAQPRRHSLSVSPPPNAGVPVSLTRHHHPPLHSTTLNSDDMACAQRTRPTLPCPVRCKGMRSSMHLITLDLASEGTQWLQRPAHKIKCEAPKIPKFKAQRIGMPSQSGQSCAAARIDQQYGSQARSDAYTIV